MNYSAYLETRKADIEKAKAYIPEEVSNIAEMGVKTSTQILPLITTVKERLESFFGHTLENAEVDQWVGVLTTCPELAEAAGVTQEIIVAKRIGEKLVADLFDL